MITSRFDPQELLQRADTVALLVPASELFGLLKRSLDLPAAWAALVRRRTGEFGIVPPGGCINGIDAEDVVFARVTPIDLTFNVDSVPSRDAFQCQVHVRLRLGLIPERGELVSFVNTILGSYRLATATTLVRRAEPLVRDALLRLAAQHDAADLVDGKFGQSGPSAVQASVEPLCFSAGMTVDPSIAIQFLSATFQQVRQAQEEASRRRHQQQAARQVQEALERAQSQHLDHLSTLLKRLSDLSAQSPQAGLAELIQTFAEHQRGEVYEALFASEPAAAKTKWLVVAAGEDLLFFDPVCASSTQRRLRIEGAAGPVRSVQCLKSAEGRHVLFVGAATGVYRLPLDRAEPDLKLMIPQAPEVRGGFNAVALAGDSVWASHSELGLYQWRLDAPVSGRPRFAGLTGGARTVRAVHWHDGHLFCALDNRIIRWPAEDESDQPAAVFAGSRAPITSLIPHEMGLFAGNADGDVLFWPSGETAVPQRLSTGQRRACESVWVLDSHGVRRVVYTDTSLHVHARVVGDSFLCRYEAGGQTLRRVEVAPDILVATNELRDRLFCWKPGQPGRPSETIHVSALCGRSIQDVCLVPEA